MADTKISALPATSTPLSGSELVPVVQSGVTSNVSVTNLTAGRNITFNNTLPGYTTTATAAGTTTLTSSSTYHQRFTGSSGQTVVLPAATTMSQGQGFIIDNDASGVLALQDGSTASLGSVNPGMAVYVFCESNSTTAGNWSGYMFVPGAGPSGQVTWGTVGLNMGGGTISSLGNTTLSTYSTIAEARSALTTYSTSVPITLTSQGSTYLISIWGSLNNAGTYGTASVLLMVNNAYGYPYTVYGPAIATVSTLNFTQTGTGPTFSFTSSVNGVVNLTMTGTGTKQYGYSIQAIAIGGAY